MRGSDKTGRFRASAPAVVARHRDADIYYRYAVGLYRQALFGAIAHVRADRVPEIRPRDPRPLVRAVLRRLITSLAAAESAGGNNAKTRLRHGNRHGSRGSHAGTGGAQVTAGRAALPEDEKNVTDPDC